MGDLFPDYEKQFGLLTADVTARITKVPNLTGVDKQNAIIEVDQKFEEVQELLEQMDLEVREMPTPSKQTFSSKLKSYKEERQRLETEFKKAKIAFSDQESARAELLTGDDVGHSEDQRSRLLDNSERLQRSSRRLDDGYKMCLETEEIGADILQNLQRDREVIHKTRDRLRGTDSNLTHSSRILTGMMRRIIQNRIILAVVCLSIIVVIGLVIYYATKGH